MKNIPAPNSKNDYTAQKNNRNQQYLAFFRMYAHHRPFLRRLLMVFHRRAAPFSALSRNFPVYLI